tara:strand:+ start:4329 stop:6098 length:1770 start_codon:yes stop_codon:yes gene_type:complete
MYTLELTKSLGRTGNCMLCVINAIYFAEKYNISKVIFDGMRWWTTQLLPNQPNEIIKAMQIDIQQKNTTRVLDIKDILKKRCSLIWNNKKNQFESWFCGFYLGDMKFEDRIYIVHKYINPIFNFSPVNYLNDNDLVIHLRSGDIMNSGHAVYIQPPLQFYIDVIESKEWNDIYIITEHQNNPCFNSLIKKYTKIIHFLNNKKNRTGGNGYGFKFDMGILLAAKNLVVSNSSLSPFIIQMSYVIKNVYMPSFYLRSRGKNHARENQVWWTNDLKDKKEEFKINDIQFHVLDYDKYVDTSEPIYNYHEKRFKDYLINYKNNSVFEQTQIDTKTTIPKNIKETKDISIPKEERGTKITYKDRNIACIIARYNENISWSDDIKKYRIIYNKGPADLDIPNETVYKLQNIGKEGDTYLKYIINNYDNLPENVMFLQGNLYDSHLKDWHTNKEDVVWVINNIEKISKHNIKYIGLNKTRGNNGWNSFDNFLDPFEYYRSPQLKKNLILTKHNFPFMFKKKNKDECDVNIICNYCGMFLASKSAILDKPKDFYTKLNILLLKDQNYGFCLERLWKHIFDPNTEEIINIDYVRNLII